MNSHLSAAQAERRRALRWLGVMSGAACLPTSLALAAPSHNPQSPRLVVVMLRGALDGLAAVPAIGDPAWADLRGGQPAGAGPLSSGAPSGLSGPSNGVGSDAGSSTPRPLDRLFSMHPSLAELHRWYTQGQLLVLHAVASPYRERSHFDAQQLLESGGERPFALDTGWLGRALQVSAKPGVALTATMPLALRGADGASTWTPNRRAGSNEDLLARVTQLYQGDAALSGAWAQALSQQNMTQEAGMASGAGGDAFALLAKQAGSFLSAANGPRVAWLEAGGWDTHTQQAGRLQRLLAGLDQGLAAMRDALGPHWSQTTVLVMTEFGRSAVLNGSGGSDHGTAGVAFVAGGAVAGGRVVSDWPGLARNQLLDGRDLRPTLDVRHIVAPLLQRQFGLSQAQLSAGVLPGVTASRLELWRA